MAGLDDVLERLVADPSFRQRLAVDPSAALVGYELSEEERGLLASQLTDDAGAGGTVEARASKASMAGLFGALEELVGASAELTAVGQPDVSPGAGNDSDKWINLDSYNIGVNQTGGDVGDDVLVGGAGGDDAVLTAPSGSGHNELSVQDTSGRETMDAINLPGYLASDDIVPPPNPSSSAPPIDSIGQRDRLETWELQNSMISSYSISSGGDEPTDAPGELGFPTDLTPGDEKQRVEPSGIADVVVVAGAGTQDPEAPAPTGLADGTDALVWDPGDGSDVAKGGEGTLQESISFNFEQIRVTYDPDQVGGGPIQAPDAIAPVAGDGGSDAPLDHGDLLVTSFQSSGPADGEPTPDGIADLVVGTESAADGTDLALIDPAATAPVEAGFDYPGAYAEHFDGIDESAPDDGLDVLIAGHTVHESQDMVPEDQTIAIGGDADRATEQGGGIVNDSGTMTLVGSTLTPSDDTVPADQSIAIDGGDSEQAGGDRFQPAAWVVPILPFVEGGDDATAGSLADPAPPAADGWVNVGQTEQFLFDNTDIAEPEIEDVAPPESSDPEPSTRGAEGSGSTS